MEEQGFIQRDINFGKNLFDANDSFFINKTINIINQVIKNK